MPVSYTHLDVRMSRYEMDFMASKGVHQGFGRLHDAAFVAPRLHGRSVHREADARTRRQTFGVGRRPAQLHRVYLLVVFAGAVVDDVVENDVVGAAHVEGIIGGAEMRPVVFGGFAVGEFVQVVVVIADHAVNGDSERCELLPDLSLIHILPRHFPCFSGSQSVSVCLSLSQSQP